MPRLFVALPLSEPTRRVLAEAAARLPAGPWLRWVPAENLHVTLRFLGHLPDPRPVAAAAREAAAQTAPGPLRFVGLGSFPGGGLPRVLWAGVEAPWLHPLVEALEDALARRGIPREGRPFRPHVTLARVRAQPGTDSHKRRQWWADVRAALQGLQRTVWAEETATALVLMESLLRPQGAQYRELERFRLGARAPGGGGL